MISGLYKSASAMTIEEVKHDVLANNVANAATVGFKKDNVVISPFDEILSSASRKIGGSETLYQSPIGGIVSESLTDFSQGPIKRTDNELDVAITGDGFFAVETPEGIRYTRSGNFALSSDNQLVMAGSPGHAVLASGNTPVTIPGTGGKITIDKRGGITVGNESAGRLQVTDFEKPYRLRKVGDNLFAPVGEGTGEDAAEGSYTIENKALEMSNVNIIEEMVSMIINQRIYQTSQKMIQAQDQTLQSAINDVGRV